MDTSLTPEQMKALTPQGTSSAAPSSTQNPPWLQSMLDASLKSDQSAAVLGHATDTMNNAFQTPLTNIASGQGQNNQDVAIGAAKQGAKDLSMAGAQNAGPVGAAMTANSPGLAKDFQSFNSAVAPSNMSQQVGAGMTGLAESAVPVGAAAKSGLIEKGVNAAADTSLGKMLQDFMTQRATNKATKAVQSTAETMTKGERETAIAENRLKPGIFKNSYLPSETDSRAGELLSGQVGKNPIKNVPVIQNEIANRGKEAETFLEQNAQPISNEEDFNAFQKQRAKTETYLTPTATKAYDEMINVFQKTLKKYVGDGGYNTANYYKGLKDFESNVTQNLLKGKEALLDEGGSARLQAAKDVRTTVRNMIGEKNPEFKGKMFDLASLYNARDNVITKADKSGHAIQQFAKNHPIVSAVAGGLGATAGYQELKKTPIIGGILP